MRESTVGSCASAGRYSLCTIDGGTCQVGLTVMNFIVSLSSGVGMHHPEREVRLVDDHMRGAEVARIPAPALHVGEDRLDLPRAIAFLGACGAAQFRERRLEFA